jgi:hypothetical protein
LAGKIGNDLWKSTWKGGLIGMGSGALMGGIGGGIDAYRSNKNVWLGRDIGMGRSPFSFKNSDMPFTDCYSELGQNSLDYIERARARADFGKPSDFEYFYGTKEQEYGYTNNNMGFDKKTRNLIDIQNNMERNIYIGNAKGRLQLDYYGWIEPGYNVNISFDGVNVLTLPGKYGNYGSTTVYVPSGTKYVNIQINGYGFEGGTTAPFFTIIRGVRRFR